MEGHWPWLILIALIAGFWAVFQFRESEYLRLKNSYRDLEAMHRSLQQELKKSEFDNDLLERSLSGSWRWISQAQELKREVKKAKKSQDYLSAKRLQNLEKYVARSAKENALDTIFIETFEPLRSYSFKDRLIRMLDRSEFEIIIISPWIKRHTWNVIRPYAARLVSRGGSLKIFMRGIESDFITGMSDDIREEVAEIGGEVILISQLHAKIYLVDQKEMILASANLTRGGIESNFEAGIWSSNPVILKDIYAFIENLQIEVIPTWHRKP